jgi:hypothetical protein
LANKKSLDWWGAVEEKISSDDNFDEQWADARWSAVASDIRKKRLKDKPYASALIPAVGDVPTFPPESITIEP